MLSVLANRTYRHLFAAQVIALIGTGLMTVALGLLAFRIAGENAGAVLGTALAIKMVAYVLVAPVVGGLAGRLPRRPFLVAMDLTRAAVAIALPFIDQVWEVYVLIFVLQSASPDSVGRGVVLGHLQLALLRNGDRLLLLGGAGGLGYHSTAPRGPSQSG